MPASEERIAAARRRIDAYNSMSPEEKEKVHNSTTQSRLLARARRLAQAKKMFMLKWMNRMAKMRLS